MLKNHTFFGIGGDFYILFKYGFCEYLYPKTFCRMSCTPRISISFFFSLSPSNFQFMDKKLVGRFDPSQFSEKWREEFTFRPSWCDADMSLQQINAVLLVVEPP